MEKTTKLTGLFVAAVLVASTLSGCGDDRDEEVSEQAQAVCNDDDDDGYCDDGSGDVDHSFGFIYIGNHKQYYKKGYYPKDGKVYRSAKVKQSTTGSGSGSGTTTTTKPQPPKSSSGTGSVVSGSNNSSSGSKSSSKTGVSSGSKGGIGSSSSSSSS